jgi:2-polyprenyl-6-hydroxyphenyl methylase/3-demethylubiquinone-9 3-methyltransferase
MTRIVSRMRHLLASRGSMSKQQSAGHHSAAGGEAVDAREVDKFEAMAAEVWDPDGPMRPLHRLNPLRIGYIRDQAAAHLGTGDAAALRPFSGVRLVDIGCGAGLLSEPMARLGAVVTGIDPSTRSIGAAKAHAAASDLEIDYRSVGVETLAEGGADTGADAGEVFDIVLAMEVIEHTSDPDLFICQLADITRPGGLLVMSTLNRTVKSYLLGIVAAEYLLGWLPKGTHQWQRFIEPSMLARLLRRRGFRVVDTTGVVYRPALGDFVRSRDRDVNYMISAVRD